MDGDAQIVGSPGGLGGMAAGASGEPDAEPAPDPAPAGQSLTYYFPIEVEIVGELGPQHREELARQIYEELEDALRVRS